MLLLALLASAGASLNPKLIVTLREDAAYQGDFGLGITQPALIEQPSKKQIDRAFDKPSTKWLYSRFVCKGFTAEGYLRGCKAAGSTNDANERLRSLVGAFRIAPGKARQLKPYVDVVLFAVEVRFAGVSWSDECAQHGFCTLTPPPPPPGMSQGL